MQLGNRHSVQYIFSLDISIASCQIVVLSYDRGDKFLMGVDQSLWKHSWIERALFN